MKQNQSKKPLGVYIVEDRGNGKSYWNRIGVAFAHNDSAGFNVELTAVPLSGRLVIRESKTHEEAGQ